MATASSFGDRGSRVSFDRIELDERPLGDRAFELSEGVELASTEVQSVTWVYDQRRDTVMWSAPVEHLFGFEEGVRGFTVLRDDGQGEPCEVRSSDDSGADADFVSGPDTGEKLLAPILAPIRHGVGLSEFDLHVDVRCPDGVIHNVVVRASPMPIADNPMTPSSDGSRDGTVFDDEGVFYVGVAVDVTGQRRFERELGELVDRYRLLTEVSPDIVFVHQDGRFVYGNRAMGRMIGAETDEQYAEAFAKYYGTLMTDFTHPDDIADVAERLAQLTEPGQFFEHGEVRWFLPSGEIKMMELTSIRTTWAGEPAYQVIARDMSERRAAEAANRYRASLVAHVSDAIIGIDADGKIESWNEAAETIYGWTEEEVSGLSLGAV